MEAGRAIMARLLRVSRRIRGRVERNLPRGKLKVSWKVSYTQVTGQLLRNGTGTLILACLAVRTVYFI